MYRAIEKDSSLDLKFKALADKNRRKILIYLKNGSRPAGEIAMQLPISAPSVSYHLSILERSHLISSYQSNRYIFYQIEFSEIDEVMSWLKMVYSTEERGCYGTEK